jgi:hypothetical protein
MIFISLGPTCHPAGNLGKLHLRNQSLPFDWLLISELKGFEYANSLIDTNLYRIYNTIIEKR